MLYLLRRSYLTPHNVSMVSGMIVTVLGAGAMGSALTIPLSDRGHEVRL